MPKMDKKPKTECFRKNHKKFDVFSNSVYTYKNKHDSSIVYECGLNCPRTQIALDFRANSTKKSRWVQCLQGFVGILG